MNEEGLRAGAPVERRTLDEEPVPVGAAWRIRRG